MNVEQTIRQYLPHIIHMSLATCNDNLPWVCEVHFSYDDDLNIYFRSKLATRHAAEIAQNSCVAGNMIIQHGLKDAPQGVYFEGKAEMLTDVDENHPAFITNCERFENDTAILDDAAAETGHKFFKITVSDWYLFDARESKPSQKYHLDWK